MFYIYDLSGNLLFKCYDGSTIIDELERLGLTKHQVKIKRKHPTF